MVLGVLAFIALAIGASLALVFLIAFTKAIIQIAISNDEVAKMNCNHDNCHYSESHPDKVWRCNDYGADF